MYSAMAGRSKLIRRAYVRTTKVTEKTEPATAETTTMRTDTTAVATRTTTGHEATDRCTPSSLGQRERAPVETRSRIPGCGHRGRHHRGGGGDGWAECAGGSWRPGVQRPTSIHRGTECLARRRLLRLSRHPGSQPCLSESVSHDLSQQPRRLHHLAQDRRQLGNLCRFSVERRRPTLTPHRERWRECLPKFSGRRSLCDTPARDLRTGRVGSIGGRPGPAPGTAAMTARTR